LAKPVCSVDRELLHSTTSLFLSENSQLQVELFLIGQIKAGLISCLLQSQ
jgi:hypothetical protein